MKKFLLTLMLMLCLSAVAKAEKWTYTPASKCVDSNTMPQTKTFNNISWTISGSKLGTNEYIAYANSSPFTTSIQIGSAASPYSYISLKSNYFEAYEIKSISIKLGQNQYCSFSGGIKVGEQIVKSFASTEISSTAYSTISVSEINKSGAVEFYFDNSVSATGSKKNGGLYISTITIEYEAINSTPSSKIDLVVDKLLVKANGQIIDPAAEIDNNTTLSFFYLTDVENPEITYSYDIDNSGKFINASEYVFTGQKDIKLTVKAESNNILTKEYSILKKYPTVCPAPKFSEKDGAEVYEGKVITVDANGAEGVSLEVNGEPVEGTSYTVAGNIGDEITLHAVSFVIGRETRITNDQTITVTIVEQKEVTYDFIANGYGMTQQTGTSSTWETEITSIELSPVTLTFNSGIEYRWWKATDNTELRFSKNQSNAFVIYVPEEMYITSIKFTGTYTGMTSDTGSMNKGVWSEATDKHVSEVVFSVGGTRPDIQTITVSYDYRTIVRGFTHHNVEKLSDTSLKFNYHLNVDGHKDSNKYVVSITLTDKKDPSYTVTASNDEHELYVPAAESSKMRVAPASQHVGSVTFTDIPADKDFSATVSYGLEGEEPQTETINGDDITTALSTISVDGVKAEYFDLMGRKVEMPAAGSILIERKGAEVRKVIVK